MSEDIDFKSFFKGFSKALEKLQKFEEKRNKTLKEKFIKKEIDALEEIERYIHFMENNHDLFDDYLTANFSGERIKLFDMSLQNIANLLYRDNVKEELKSLLSSEVKSSASLVKKMVMMIVLGASILNVAGNAFAGGFKPLEEATPDELAQFEQFKQEYYRAKLKQELAKLGMSLEDEQQQGDSVNFELEKKVSRIDLSHDNLSEEMKNFHDNIYDKLSGSDKETFHKLRLRFGLNYAFNEILKDAVFKTGKPVSEITPQDFVNALKSYN